MAKRPIQQFHDLEDTEDFDEYSLTLEKDISDIKFSERQKKWSKQFILKMLLAVICASITIYFLGSWIYMEFHRYMGMVNSYMLKNKTKGIFIYSIAFIIGMQVFIPPGTFITCTTITFMKMYGNVEGIFVHLILVIIIEHIGIFVTYFIGRYFIRIGDLLAKRMEYFDIFNKLVVTKGAKITFLLRMCLLIPYDIVNYIMSTTDIPLWDYFIGNHGFLIDFVISTYIGIFLSNLSKMDPDSKTFLTQITFMGFGVILTAIVLFLVIRMTKREFDQMIKNESIKKSGRITGPKLA
ncbi:unnamed protein product [Moneuplotes crassus]|uniref:VTT domain-containing protein n=2 Tax=Euplotes crassus TaxID=5936 RepID=A0AAD2D069_EUPCR|nr:unnamed protein product [Moneuplotes crassus]